MPPHPKATPRPLRPPLLGPLPDGSSRIWQGAGRGWGPRHPRLVWRVARHNRDEHAPCLEKQDYLLRFFSLNRARQYLFMAGKMEQCR